jgi:hypothetical protein
VYEEGGVGKSYGGEDLGSTTEWRGGTAVLQLRRQLCRGRRRRRRGRWWWHRGRLTGVLRRWRDGAPASVTSREAAAALRVAHWRTKKVARWCSGFSDGGVEGGDGDVEGGGIKGDVEGGSPAYEEGGGGAKVGQADGAKPRDSAIRVSRQRGYSPYTRSFLVSAELCQPIPIIFCIGWVTSVDTNKPPPINTTHTPLF